MFYIVNSTIACNTKITYCTVKPCTKTYYKITVCFCVVCACLLILIIIILILSSEAEIKSDNRQQNFMNSVNV